MATAAGRPVQCRSTVLIRCSALVLITSARLGMFDARATEVDWRRQVELLEEHNRILTEQLRQQGAMLTNLTAKVTALEREQSERPDSEATGVPVVASRPGERVILSAEGAVAFYKTGSDGAYPNSEFKVDELRLFLDANAYQDIYAFVELNLATHEAQDVSAQLGEAYIDFEGVSRLWGDEAMMSMRAGRLDVPFGEEYLHRDAIDDPLISHSVMDFWGIDEGMELYGRVVGIHYVFAVQNGSTETTGDFTEDKALVGRLGYDPARWLHLGLSGMRTGDLDAANEWSEIWVGNGFFRSIGSTNTTRFDVNLVQGDVRVHLPHGHLHFSGGYARYDDNDPLADNQRDLWFYSAEVVHVLVGSFYAGARFSQILVDGGYPLVGQGNFSQFYFGPLTEDLWRLSLGAGYRWGDNVVLKTEYSFERGKLVNGNSRSDEDLFAAQVAFRF